MEDKSEALNIVHLNYDWRDLFRTDPKMVLQKYDRDLLYPKFNNFLTISWSSEKYEKKFSDTIYTVHLKARLKWFKPLYDLAFIFKAPKIVHSHNFKPDIILVYEAPFLPAAYAIKRKAGGKIVFCLTNLAIEYSSTRRFGYIKAIYSWCMLKMSGWFTDYVYTINNVVKDYLREHTSIPEENMRIFVSDTIKQDIASGVDASETGQLDVRRKHGVDTESFLFSVGRIQNEKGFERLFKVLSTVTDINYKLFIAGKVTNQRYYESLLRLLSELGITEKVVFLGELSREEIWQYYRQADAFILLSRAEALGLVFWEAMYAGCPVLGSRASGIVESLGEHEERGFLWDEKDGVEEFQKKLLAMLDKKEKVQAQVIAARKYVEEKVSNNYSINDLAKEVL